MRTKERIGIGWGRRAAALVVTGSLAFGACASSEGATSGNRPNEAAVVDIDTFVYRPKTITVPVGTTVRWTNGDDILHTVTSGEQTRQGVPGVERDKPSRPDGTFDLELDGKGSFATFAFEEPGTYEYFCRVHAAMTGRIVVE